MVSVKPKKTNINWKNGQPRSPKISPIKKKISKKIVKINSDSKPDMFTVPILEGSSTAHSKFKVLEHEKIIGSNKFDPREMQGQMLKIENDFRIVATTLENSDSDYRNYIRYYSNQNNKTENEFLLSNVIRSYSSPEYSKSHLNKGENEFLVKKNSLIFLIGRERVYMSTLSSMTSTFLNIIIINGMKFYISDLMIDGMKNSNYLTIA